MRNVKAEFEYHGVAVPFVEDTPIDRVKAAMDKTNVEKSLAWLHGQVRQTVERLRQQGYEAEVISALGLDKPSAVR